MGLVPPDSPDEVPAGVVAHAKEAFRWRTRGEIASLVFDSLIDKGAPAEDHQLQFEHPGLQVELHVSARREGSSLSGRIDPPTARYVEVEFDSNRTVSGADVTVSGADVTDGAFAFEELRHGVIRLNLHGTTEAPVVHTDWFSI